MKNITLDIVLGSLVFYDLKNELKKNMLTYLATQGETEVARSQGFASKWGWYQSIYGLANGDLLKYDSITKQNLHKCLTFLSFEKDKCELESQILKNKMK